RAMPRRLPPNFCSPLRSPSASRMAPAFVDDWLTNVARIYAFCCATVRDEGCDNNSPISLVESRCRGSAGGGDRTHTILRSLDFESSASASSATPAAKGSSYKIETGAQARVDDLVA